MGDDSKNTPFSPDNIIRWNAALGGSMENYISRLLLNEIPDKDSNNHDNGNNTDVFLDNRYHPDGDNDKLEVNYFDQYLNYDGNKNNNNDTNKKYARPTRSALLSREVLYLLSLL